MSLDTTASPGTHLPIAQLSGIALLLAARGLGLAMLIVGAVGGCDGESAARCEELVPLVSVDDFALVPPERDPYVSGDPAAFFADRTASEDDRPRLCRPDEARVNNLAGEPVFDVDTFNCNWSTVEQPLLHDIEEPLRLRMRIFYFSQLATFLTEGRNVVTVGDQVVLDEVVGLPTESGILGFDEARVIEGKKGDTVMWHVGNHGENSWNFIELSMVREIPCPSSTTSP